MKNILFTGGGTLGHIYPMVSVVKELKEKGYKLFFIGTTKGLEKEYLEKHDVFEETFFLDSEGIKRSLSIKNIRAIYKHLRNIKKSRKILEKNKIDLVVGMGGYISASVVRSAQKLKIKTVIHEQNSVFGLANKLVHKKVDRVLLTYDIDKGENAVVVGNPRVSEIYAEYKNCNNYNIGNYVLIVGGSRGATKINELIIGLKDQFINSNINVLLITGKKYYKENNDLINEISEESFKIIDFSYDLPKLLIEAKVVVSRSGASTIAEILALKKVNLLIPSPNVTDNHQEKNASHVVNLGCGLMLKEDGLTKSILFDTIYKLYYNKDLRNSIINNIIFTTKTDARDLFVSEIEKLLENKWLSRGTNCLVIY